MARILLAVPPGAEPRLERELERHGHTRVGLSGRDPAGQILPSGCDVVVVSATPAYLGVDLLAASDAAGVRVVGLIGSDADRRHAAGVGLAELAAADDRWEVIEALIAGEDPVTEEAEQAPRAGRVIAVWGPAGSPGRTTLAIAIAAEIAAAGHTVAVADVDTYSGSVAPALALLDESPGFAAACRLAGAGALTRAELERIGSRYLSGHGSFWVLTGIGRPSRWPELSGERVAATLRACREWVDYTVVDTGFSLENDEEISSDLFAPRRNAATITALREADQVIAVGSADPVGLSRFLRAYVDLVELILTTPVTVMNRIRSGAVGPGPAAQVGQALRRFGGIDDPVLVPFDLPAFDGAVLSGRSLRDAAMRSPARQAIGRLVESRILPTSAARVTRRSLHGRRSLPHDSQDWGPGIGPHGGPDVVR